MKLCGEVGALKIVLRSSGPFTKLTFSDNQMSQEASQLEYQPKFEALAKTETLQECIRAPPKRGRDWEIHPLCLRDFPRPKRFPQGEA